MQRSETYTTKYKCGHYAAMPPYVTTPDAAKNYARWAKGQGLCLKCHSKSKTNEASFYSHQNGFANLVGSVKQVQWALTIRHGKLKALDLAHRQAAFQQHFECAERLRLAHDKLARSSKAHIWIEARDLGMDELVNSCLGPSV